jgi:hypothetical protein
MIRGDSRLPREGSTFVKRLKRIVLLAPVAFLAFAPPGTLIVAGLIVAGTLGLEWLLVAGAGVLTTVALLWLARRRRRPR